MGRPPKERRIEQLPSVTYYKPSGIPLRDIDEITLTLEEMEAIRLADVEDLDQAAAAERMEISRPTFHRIVSSAHKKIATALWQGAALRVDGGSFRYAHCRKNGMRNFLCHNCGNEWSLPFGNGECCTEVVCPACHSAEIDRTS